MKFYLTFRKFKFDPYLYSLKFVCISDTNYVRYKRVACGQVLPSHPVHTHVPKNKDVTCLIPMVIDQNLGLLHMFMGSIIYKYKHLLNLEPVMEKEKSLRVSFLNQIMQVCRLFGRLTMQGAMPVENVMFSSKISCPCFKFSSHHSKQFFPFTCQSCNIVYLMECKTCKQSYIM